MQQHARNTINSNLFFCPLPPLPLTSLRHTEWCSTVRQTLSRRGANSDERSSAILASAFCSSSLRWRACAQKGKREDSTQRAHKREQRGRDA